MTDEADDTQIGLAQAIEQVRKELTAVRRGDTTKDIQFRLGEVTLEFAVEFAREGKMETGVKFWVVNVGASGSVSSSRTNTVTVTMTPQEFGSDGSLRDVAVSKQVSGRPPAAPAPGN